MSRWYRAYEGTCTDAKLGEVALIADCSRAVAIAAWHCLLENCAGLNDGGRFDLTARRLAVILCEPVAKMADVFNAFEELAMTQGGVVTAWSSRQFESDKDPTAPARMRRYRARKANEEGDVTPVTRNGDGGYAPHSTETETETDTEIREEREPLSETGKPVSDLSAEKPKAKRKAYPDEFEAFWRAYPTDANMGKSETFEAWKRISPDERLLAVAAVPPFLDYCAKHPTYRPIHAVRFLSKRRFEGHAAAIEPRAPPVTGEPIRIRTDAEIIAELEAMEAEHDHRSDLPAGSLARDEGETAEPGRLPRLHLVG